MFRTGSYVRIKHGLQQRNPNLFFSSFLLFPDAKQALSKDVTSKKDEMNKLGRELDLTEQACRPLRQNFYEYCPDIGRQKTEVKRLKNRYANINNQLQER